MRYFRLVAGSIVIVGALYVLVAEHVTGASSNAFVNAPVVTVRAPVSGDADIPLRPIGAEVTQSTVLFTISDERADHARLDDLLLEQEQAMAQVERLEALKRVKTAHEARLDGLYSAYVPAALRAQIEPFQVDLSDPDKVIDLNAAIPVLDGASEEVTRSEILKNSPLFSQDGQTFPLLDDAGSAAWNFAYWSEMAAHQVEQVEVDLAAARAVAASYEDRISRERARLIGLSGGDITSPAHGVIWERMVGNGVTVERGDPVMKIADCGASVVSLSVSEMVYNRLRTGDPAIFRMSGSDRVMSGTVARLAGAGAAQVYDHMAVRPNAEHLQRYDVTLIMPELREVAGSEGCGIGRTGRVFFEDRPLDPLRRLFQ